MGCFWYIIEKMKTKKYGWRNIFVCLVFVAASFMRAPVTHAAPLAVFYDAQSSTASNTIATHTIHLTTSTTNTMKRISIQFSVGSNGGLGKPAHLDLSGVTLGTLVGLDSNWSLDLSDASIGFIYLERTLGISITAGTALTIPLIGVVNSSIGDCTPPDTLTDACWIKAKTIEVDDVSEIDSAENNYFITEAPYVNFELVGTNVGETHNGVTTTGYATVTTLNFGKIEPGTPQYLTQELTIHTNAPHGYTIYVEAANNMTGTYGSSTISPFGATNATWITPQSWTNPTGTTPGSNTGWFGANTSDTRVTGWAYGTSGKFGPISTIPHPVAFSSSADRSGSTIYVSYVLGVNSMQPADLYSGSLTYDVETNY
jgi:hypothetical protein